MDWTQPTEPVDEASFRQALAVVVGTAHQNGVAMERDWVCRGPGDPDWVVEVARLASGGEGDDR